MSNTGSTEGTYVDADVTVLRIAIFFSCRCGHASNSKALSNGAGTDSVERDLGVGPGGWLSLALIHLLSLNRPSLCLQAFIHFHVSVEHLLYARPGARSWETVGSEQELLPA